MQTITGSLGSIIALIVLLIAVVLIVIMLAGVEVGAAPLLILGLIAALAVARLT